MEPAFPANARPWALLFLSFFFGLGCATPHRVAKIMVSAPNQQSFYPARRLADHWAQVLHNPHSPFRSYRTAVGSIGDAEIALMELPPANYHAVVDSEITQATNGQRFLNVTFKFLGTPSTRVPERGTIFLLHGYMVSKELMIPWAFLLAEQGYRTVLVDIRGHGSSTGDNFTFGKQETQDMIQVLNFCETMGISKGEIGVLGISFGAALGLHWMATDDRVKTVVAIASYNHLTDALGRLVKEGKLPVPKVSQNLGVKLASHRTKLNWAEWSVERAVQKTKSPILFIGGATDTISRPADLDRVNSPLGSLQRVWW